MSGLFYIALVLDYLVDSGWFCNIFNQLFSCKFCGVMAFHSSLQFALILISFLYCYLYFCELALLLLLLLFYCLMISAHTFWSFNKSPSISNVTMCFDNVFSQMTASIAPYNSLTLRMIQAGSFARVKGLMFFPWIRLNRYCPGSSVAVSFFRYNPTQD